MKDKYSKLLPQKNVIIYVLLCKKCAHSFLYGWFKDWTKWFIMKKGIILQYFTGETEIIYNLISKVFMFKDRLI